MMSEQAAPPAGAPAAENERRADMDGGRAAMLARIRTGLGATRAALAAEAERAPHTPPGFVHPPQEDLAAQFAEELARLEGHAHRCADAEEALETIRSILLGHAAKEAITWNIDQVDLPGLDALLDSLGVRALDGQIREGGLDRDRQLQELASAQVCISGADLAIAESGTLLLRSGAGRARLASLLAPVHIAVLQAGAIVRGLGAALALLQARHGPDIFADSSNLTLISGPSRTGDIEQTLVLGAHGPREIHVVIVGDSRASGEARQAS
jgi:L-lactate dehydrogenase complex protein LldG